MQSSNGVAVSADGRGPVSASWDKTLKVWDVDTGCELCTLEGHTGSVYGVAISGHGRRRAASASGDQMLRVWDIQTGAQIATFACDAQVQCCAIIGGDNLIAADNLGHVHFLRVEKPKCRD